MECLGLDFPLLLQTVYDVLVTPADFVRQTLLQLDEHTESQAIAEHKYLDRAVLATRLQPQHPQGLRDNHPLLAVIWRRNTLVELQALQGSGTPGALVRSHSSDGPGTESSRAHGDGRGRIFWG